MPTETLEREAPYKKLTRSERLKALAEPKLPPPGVKVIAQFKDPEGEFTGPPLNLPIDATPEQLALLLNHLLQNVFSIHIGRSFAVHFFCSGCRYCG